METRPLYEIPGIQSNDVAELDAFQAMVAPHINLIQSLWWMLWWGTLVYLFARFILVPLYENHFAKTKPAATPAKRTRK